MSKKKDAWDKIDHSLGNAEYLVHRLCTGNVAHVKSSLANHLAWLRKGIEELDAGKDRIEKAIDYSQDH